MNKHHHKEARFSFTGTVISILAFVILLTSGVVHAWLKNSQVEVIREANQAEKRITDHQDAINSLQVKIDKKLNIYQLRDDLERANSALQHIPVSSVEVIPAYSSNRSQVRASQPPTSIVHSNP